MTGANIKISLLILIVIFIAMLLYINVDTRLEKPTMNIAFKPLLVRNENAFTKAVGSDSLTKEFDKPIPKSLEGIDLNIFLPVDDKGNLIVGMELKDLFELYLSAMGEEELDDILLRIQNALAQQLSPPALEQSYDALKRFIDYKIELINLEQQPHDNSLSELENIRRQKEILSSLQQEYFSPIESDALFTEEKEYDDFMLEYLAIQQNNNLTSEEKQQQIESLEVSLPADIKAGRDTAMAPANIFLQAETMRAEGKTPEEIYQMRAQSLGSETADALAELDQQRQQWQQRLTLFHSRYKSIISSGLSEVDQKIEMNALLARDFNELESIRVRAKYSLSYSDN
jgi:lipase chaperone LimK